MGGATESRSELGCSMAAALSTIIVHVMACLYAMAAETSAAGGSSCSGKVHTVSGVSSGGSMAMLHALIHSSCVKGVGVVAGSEYGCNALLSTCPGACDA